jgi:hypothetical protein
MNEQISWSLSDEVAPHFPHLGYLCTLIDTKQQKGYRYKDLLIALLKRMEAHVDLNNQAPQFDIYRRAYEFARYY